MPAPKKRSSTPPKPRTQSVPVRVVASTPKPAGADRPASNAAVPARRQPGSPTERRRRTMMWAGVAVVGLIIFVLWLAFIRSDLSQPSNDSFFSRIGTELRQWFNSIRPFQPEIDNANTDAETEQLRERVFPEIKPGEFRTEPNANANENLNSNANVSP